MDCAAGETDGDEKGKCSRSIFWIQPLTKRRRYAAAAAIGKRLYVVGGYDGRQRMNSVECLDLSQENASWQPVASLTYRRGRSPVLSSDHFSSFSLSALPGVCVHQSRTLVFSPLSLFNFSKDLIYVCGGFDGSSRLASTECYDEKTDTWTPGEEMHVGREGAGLVAIGDHLYCIGTFLFTLPRDLMQFSVDSGGYDGLSLLQTVEKYGKSFSLVLNGTLDSRRRYQLGPLVTDDPDVDSSLGRGMCDDRSVYLRLRRIRWHRSFVQRRALR